MFYLDVCSSDEVPPVNGESSSRPGNESPASSTSPAATPTKAGSQTATKAAEEEGAVGGKAEDDDLG
jgi:hypothetical protein